MADTVLITGASQGIGKQTTLLFARKGYDLILAARQADRLEAVAAEVRSLGRDALAIPTDVRDSEQVNAIVQKAIAHYGAIDVLINNAGIYLLGAVEECSLSDWHQIMVGSANVSNAAYKLFPGPMQSIFRNAFATEES